MPICKILLVLLNLIIPPPKKKEYFSLINSRIVLKIICGLEKMTFDL